MGNITREEYLRLVQNLIDQQYDEMEEQVIFTPAEPEIKEKMKEAIINGIADVSNIKKNKLPDFIKKYRNFKVNKFLIKTISNDGDLLNLVIYEEKNQTESGRPAKMQYKINVAKDNRFANCDFLKYFPVVNNVNLGKKIPPESVMDIIRWLQAISKLTCFL